MAAGRAWAPRRSHIEVAASVQRAGDSPGSASVLQGVQRTAGNRAVVAMVGSQGRDAGVGRSPQVGGPRRAAFAQRGRALKLTDEQIDRLWSLGSRRSGDGYAPAEQRTGALYAAARSSATGGPPTFYIQMKIGNLELLNKKDGHSGADEAMRKARVSVMKLLQANLPEADPVADRASSFGFIVPATGRVTYSKIQQEATAVAKSVQAKTQIPLAASVMPIDEAAALAVKGDEFASSSADEAHAANEIAPNRSAEASGNFTSAGADRRKAFVEEAVTCNVSAEDAKSLYGMMLESRPDALTGFEKAADREATVRKAAGHVAETGAPAMYVEIDIRNLGGLNQARGKRTTDKWFLTMTTIAEQHMASLATAGLADALPFRHGGDEFSFVVVARSRKIDEDKLAHAVWEALKQAAAEVTTATAELADIEHSKNKPGTDPKKRRPGGTGIVWGTSPIRTDSTPESVFAEADQQVERKKAVK